MSDKLGTINFFAGQSQKLSGTQKNISVARRSIVAREYIKKGEVFTNENLTAKRPGIGISPMDWDKVIGKRSERDYPRDTLIEQSL